MPIHTVGRDGDFGYQIGARKRDALFGKTTQRDTTDHAILVADVSPVQELAELSGLGVGRTVRPVAHEILPPAPARCPSTLCPSTRSTMSIVALRRGTVEADLQRHTVARQLPQDFQTPPDEKHSVGQHGGRGGSRASGQNVADVVKQKRFAASHENLADTEHGCFARDAPHPFRAECASRRLRRRAHAAIITAQIAVEIRVQPKPRAKGARRLLSAPRYRLQWRLTTSDHPTIAALLESDFDQTIAGKATPSLEFGTNRAIGTNDCHEVARAHTTQRGNQLYKEAGRKRLSARVELDIGSRASATLSRHSRKIQKRLVSKKRQRWTRECLARSWFERAAARGEHIAHPTA